MTDTPIINTDFLVEKMEGKGGWTYVQLPKLSIVSNKPFGMVRVKGFIDDYEITQYNLMPMGNGNLFLPLKAALRKAIKKQQGDTVHLTLYYDNSAVNVPQELLDCLAEEPKALDFFEKLTENQQKYFVDWIYEAKHEDTKDRRIVQMIEKLSEGKKMYDL